MCLYMWLKMYEAWIFLVIFWGGSWLDIVWIKHTVCCLFMKLCFFFLLLYIPIWSSFYIPSPNLPIKCVMDWSDFISYFFSKLRHGSSKIGRAKMATIRRWVLHIPHVGHEHHGYSLQSQLVSDSILKHLRLKRRDTLPLVIEWILWRCWEVWFPLENLIISFYPKP